MTSDPVGLGRSDFAEYHASMKPNDTRRALTGWVYSSEFLKHQADQDHPENPDRLRAIVDRLQADGLLARMVDVDFDKCLPTEIERVHSAGHLSALLAAEGQSYDSNTYLADGSVGIAMLAVGGVLAASRAVWSGELANAFCAVRPPGHHATADRAMGFCLLNNIAIAAADILEIKHEARVLILDFDIHHGNGTQAIFDDSPRVLYASVHQFPFYPGGGAASETGRGPGRGFTVNVPLAAGDGDEEFLMAIASILDGPARRFDPDIVFISAGFDAHRDDPLADCLVTTEGFVAATRAICEFSETHCGGKVVSVLEGGYNLAALAESVSAHVSVLIDAAGSTEKI